MKIGDLVRCKTYSYTGIIVGEDTDKFRRHRWHILWCRLNRVSRRTSGALEVISESR